MKNLRSIAVLLLSLLLALSVVGCSTPAGTDAPATAAPAESSTPNVDAIKAAGKITMLTNAAFAPFEYLGDNNSVQGVDVDIAEAIAKKLGVKLEVIDMDFDGIITAIQTGKGDLGVAGITATDERRMSVDFSDNYVSTTQVIIVKEGSTIAGPDALAGLTIGVQLGTTGDLYATDYIEGAEISRYKTGSDAGLALANGQIDAVVIDQMPAQQIVDANAGLVVLDTPLTEEQYAIAIAKDKADLVAVVNEVLAELDVDAIIAKHMALLSGEEVPEEEAAVVSGPNVDAIKAAGKITMLTNAAFPPFEYLGSDNSVQGVDVDIAEAIAAYLGVELEVIDMDFDGIITAIQTGKGDLGVAGMTATDERRMSVDFSDNYVSTTQVIIVKEGSTVAGPDDLAGLVIGVQLGTTGDLYATDYVEGATISRYKTGSDAGMALANGQIDAVVIDQMPAEQIVAANTGLVVLDTPLTEEQYAIAIAKDKTDLVEAVNAVLATLDVDALIEAHMAALAE